MIQLKLAYHNLIKSRNQTFPFIITTSLWVSIIYIFLSIMLDSNLKSNPNGAPAMALLQLGVVFVVLVSVLSIMYAERAVAKKRLKELGLYNMLGLSNGNLVQIIFAENAMFYGISLVAGGMLGLVFSKLFFMILKSLIGIKNLHQAFSFEPFFVILLIFTVTFIGIFLLDILSLRKTNPANLWQKSSKPEKEPRANLLIAIMGLIVLSVGYYISVTVRPTTTAFLKFALAIVFVVIGMYMLFIVGSIALLKFMKNRKGFYYKPNHFISVANLLYRMKQNGAGLASIGLLCTSIFVALVASVSMIAGQNHLISSWTHRDIQIVQNQKLSPKQLKHIEGIAKKSDVTIKDKINATVSTPVTGAFKGNRFVKLGDNNLSKVEYTMSSLDINQYNKLQNANYHLNKNELLLYSPSERYKYRTIELNGKRYSVTQVGDFEATFNYAHSVFKTMFIIAPTKSIANKINSQKPVYVHGFDTEGSKKSKIRVAHQMEKYLKTDPANFTSVEQTKELIKPMFGAFLFVGMLVSFTMICATAMIIYYKQVSEGYADRENYKIMRGIGLTERELKRTIRSQILVIFFLPIVGATINLAFALPAIRSTLSMFSLYNLNILLSVSGLVVVGLTVCYLLIYLGTSRVYRGIVEEQ